MLAEPIKLDERPRPPTRVSRTLVEAVMHHARAGLSAYEICARLGEKLGRTVSANSVYRILNDMRRLGRARRVACSREWMLCEQGRADDLLLVCENCGTVETIPPPPDTWGLWQLGLADGFRADRLVLEVIGCCASCCGGGRSL